MFELDQEKYFMLFLALIPILILFIVYLQWRKKAIKNFADGRLWDKLAVDISRTKKFIHFWLFMLIAALSILALVNPKIGSKLKTITREGVDIVFVMDVSKSMLAEDVKPSRLDQAKQLVSKMLNEFVSDRVGIVVYAGKAYPQLPLTTDYSAARMFLKNVNTDIVPSYGTDVGSAVELALDYFENTADKKNQCIILLSDGEDHENDSMPWAKEAKEKGILIHTVAIGKESGAPIPVKENGKAIYKKDKEGQIVLTKMNPRFLKEIATTTDGIFLDGNNTASSVESVKDALLTMEKGESETELFEDYEDQFQWFLIGAILMLILSLFIGEGKTSWLRKFNV